jgi:cytochrome b involved in lipid metabolism
LNNREPFEVIKKKLPKDFFWVIFEGKAYDMSNVLHPGGNYMIQYMNGRDVECYIYGGN